MNRPTQANMYYTILKPLFDFLFALILLVFLLPVFVIIAATLAIFYRENPFFLQERGGKDQSRFKIIKFKTMNNKRDVSGKLLPDDERISKLGNFLRKVSLDEIPQLFNIIKGDMSFVGPRPFMSMYLDLYSDYQKRRHEVKPGITGWAQINGRNSLEWNEKFKLDVWYVDHASLSLDIKILFLTVVKLFKFSDVSKEGYTSSVVFNGKN